ncbi:hypothetical protein PROFUN_12512 [Planoprotostelium fungivorum]|uniref:Uncharacterized protein n=1 Tax=Planoprotostelium fungivorum TaxID=1890364 RepID=A0A2P6MS11_9EUKA|nr:hypothetical protein PROFUN_12512 [Planoprotostelium fungivorum]
MLRRYQDRETYKALQDLFAASFLLFLKNVTAVTLFLTATAAPLVTTKGNEPQLIKNLGQPEAPVIIQLDYSPYDAPESDSGHKAVSLKCSIRQEMS